MVERRLSGRLPADKRQSNAQNTPTRWTYRAGQAARAAMISRKSRAINFPGSASEDQFHLAVAEFLNLILRQPTFYTTFPAGYGKLGKGMAGKLNAKGMRAGMPDILVFHPVQPHINYSKVVGLELKVGHNTTTSKQRETHQLLWAAGVKCYTIRTLNDVLATLLANDIPFKQAAVQERLTKEVIIPSQQSSFP